MKLSDLTPASDLKDFLLSNGLDMQVYADGEKPTSGLPNEFIDILQNGSINKVTSDNQIYRANLALSINVKLTSSGAINLAKQNIILKKIEDILSSSRNFFLSTNTIFSGKSLAANYSYKTINIITKLY